MKTLKNYLNENVYKDLHDYYVSNYSNKYLEKLAGDWYEISFIFRSKFGISCLIRKNRKYRYLPDITFDVTMKKFTLNPGGYGSLDAKSAKEWIDQQNAAFMLLNTLNNIAISKNNPFPEEPEI